MTMHTSYELYLHAKDKMAKHEKEAEWDRLLHQAQAPRGLRRALALKLLSLAQRLAPEAAYANPASLAPSRQS